MAKKQNSIEGHKLNPKRNIWIIGIIVGLLVLVIFNSIDAKTEREDAVKDAISCLDDCESEYGIDICSSWTSAGDSYSDILNDNEELQYCIEDFSSCVADCKEDLEQNY